MIHVRIKPHASSVTLMQVELGPELTRCLSHFETMQNVPIETFIIGYVLAYVFKVQKVLVPTSPSLLSTFGVNRPLKKTEFGPNVYMHSTIVHVADLG